jgi:hypothetical protein
MLHMKKFINLSILTALGLMLTTAHVKAEAGWTSIIGPIVGIPVGGVAGLLRGSFSKASEYSDTFSESLGGSSLAQVVGIPTGFITGAATGGITGLLKGVVDGAVLGITEPLSPESGSLQGDVLDYEPYDIFSFGKTKAQ